MTFKLPNGVAAITAVVVESFTTPFSTRAWVFLARANFSFDWSGKNPEELVIDGVKVFKPCQSVSLTVDMKAKKITTCLSIIYSVKLEGMRATLYELKNRSLLVIWDTRPQELNKQEVEGLAFIADGLARAMCETGI